MYTIHRYNTIAIHFRTITLSLPTLTEINMNKCFELNITFVTFSIDVYGTLLTLSLFFYLINVLLSLFFGAVTHFDTGKLRYHHRKKLKQCINFDKIHEAFGGYMLAAKLS